MGKVTLKDHHNHYAHVMVDDKPVGAICYGRLGIEAITPRDIGLVTDKARPWTFPILWLEAQRDVEIIEGRRKASAHHGQG